ncbi:DeoR/GlpR transcriptional regulator [Paenibacillus donghaensis]|uniref:DeoR/GlpR family DNA-binding transcription regulator n=1 Tax=Paenibacillus donghaensis TaxID=414771 RepID=UPI001883E33D|nr:DeoR/GlpR family DNA-binding transcription regulator [Paenibacillus donghaensis]MBE9916135.1 DeoR/GlpR transcriptional regulator [Paenibacillus donghaensis]
MYQEERLVKILEHLKRHETVSNQEICEWLGISRDTARRDFIKLVKEGAAIRTHGGIALPRLKEEIKIYKERLTTASKQKLAIAKTAASHVGKRDLCFLDVSTTVRFLCEEIKEEISVYTHSLDNAEALSVNNEIDVHLLGGKLHKENRFFYDMTTASQLNELHFDKAFFGAAAVMEDGIYFSNREDAFIKQMSAKRAERVYVLTDAGKFNLTGHYKGLSFQDIDTIIIDRIPPDQYLAIFNEHQIKVEIAGRLAAEEEGANGG